jgi:hypothetical protein
MFVNFKPLFLNPALRLYFPKPVRPTDKKVGDPWSMCFVKKYPVLIYLKVLNVKFKHFSSVY